MRSVVLTKGVPDFREGKVSFDEDGHLERGKTPTVMNPNDKHALRAALQTKVRQGGDVSLMSMGPPGYAEILQDATVFRFDASDLMPGQVGTGAFWTGMVDWVNGAPLDEVLTSIDEAWPEEE